jgi:hypothetical protein
LGFWDPRGNSQSDIAFALLVSCGLFLILSNNCKRPGLPNKNFIRKSYLHSQATYIHRACLQISFDIRSSPFPAHYDDIRPPSAHAYNAVYCATQCYCCQRFCGLTAPNVVFRENSMFSTCARTISRIVFRTNDKASSSVHNDSVYFVANINSGRSRLRG